jgi:hypothetical protein
MLWFKSSVFNDVYEVNINMFFINLNNIKLYIPLNLLILNPNYKNK